MRVSIKTSRGFLLVSVDRDSLAKSAIVRSPDERVAPASSAQIRKHNRTGATAEEAIDNLAGAIEEAIADFRDFIVVEERLTDQRPVVAYDRKWDLDSPLSAWLVIHIDSAVPYLWAAYENLSDVPGGSQPAPGMLVVPNSSARKIFRFEAASRSDLAGVAAEA